MFFIQTVLFPKVGLIVTAFKHTKEGGKTQFDGSS